MTAEEFVALAQRVAGKRWRSRLGPMIGRSRSIVFEYGCGKRKVDETVAKLLRLMAK